MVCLPYCKSIFKASASNMRIPSAKKKNRVIWPVLCYICNLKIRQARALFRLILNEINIDHSQLITFGNDFE